MLARQNAQSGRALSCLVAAGALWGTSFLFGKWALETVGPVQVTLWRFVIASVALLVVPAARAVRPYLRDLPLFVLTGALMVPGTFLLQFAGLQRTNASIAALIIGTLPALVAVASWAVMADRLGRRGWLAVSASSVGVGLTVAHGAGGNNWVGDALVFASMFPVVGWVLLGKRLMLRYTPIVATTWIIICGTLLLVPLSVILDGLPRLDLPVRTWCYVFALGVGCSAAAGLLWNWGLARVLAADAGVFLNIEPFTGALLGVVVLGEPLYPTTVVGGVLILGAAVAVTRGEGHRQPRRVANRA